MILSVEERLREKKAAVEDYMAKALAGDESLLFAAMRYAVLSEGKRFRPLLVLASGESFGVSQEVLLPFACAIEFIHNYSLIHDDLPSMDNDDFRRGQPSCHRAFGENIALLAGDGLLTLAFEIMLQAPTPEAFSRRKLEAIAEVSRQAGPEGMIAGQFLDITLPVEELNEEQMIALMQKKTGALITASVKVGAIMGGASAEEMKAVEEFGRKLGLAFQVRDDILDAAEEGSSRSSVMKPNFVHWAGKERAYQFLRELVGEAVEAMKRIGRLTEEIRFLSFRLLDVAKP